jgi:translation initiation factor IF-3
LKQVQISARAAANDLLVKARQADKFLKAGHPVEIRVRLRGRENALKDWARLKLEEFLKMLAEEYKPVSEARFGGRMLTMQLVKK